jgi:Holliday junction resolvase RusA-like endonuclease
MSFEFFVPGRPRAKARPRLGRRRRAYTPQTTIDEEQRIADLYLEAGGPVFEGSIALLVDYYPEGQFIRIEQRDWHSPLNGDVDNIVKLTGDALQRVAFSDDRYVVEIHAAKFQRGECPHVEAS